MFYHVRGKLIHVEEGMAAGGMRRGGFCAENHQQHPFQAAGIAV